MTAAGRNDRLTEEFVTVDWMAYQGAPDGGVSGKTRVPEWWTGSKCKEVSFPQASCSYVHIFLKIAQIWIRTLFSNFIPSLSFHS